MSGRMEVRIGQFWLVLVGFFAIGVLFSAGALAMGEKYSAQGGRLTGALHSALAEKGFCSSPQGCQALIPGTAAHGDRVRVAFYEIGDRNMSALIFLIDTVVRQGISITGGIPITVTAYKESAEEYRKSGLFSKDVKPFLVLEVYK